MEGTERPDPRGGGRGWTEEDLHEVLVNGASQAFALLALGWMIGHVEMAIYGTVGLRGVFLVLAVYAIVSRLRAVRRRQRQRR